MFASKWKQGLGFAMAALLSAMAFLPAARAGEAPELTKLVEEGKLPPLAERLPKIPSWSTWPPKTRKSANMAVL
ncbi:MAG: hypothetical protein R3D29_00665 [Nitratireductor sp.]